MGQTVSPYSVGALLYTPAICQDIVQHMVEGYFDTPYSLALCLEDSISDAAVEAAECNVVKILKQVAQIHTECYKPLLFVRVRTPEQMMRLYAQLDEGCAALTGFIAPKCTLETLSAYFKQLEQIHQKHHIYLMPILENAELAWADDRMAQLQNIKKLLDAHRESVLNVRVGGNDLCNIFGVRRNQFQTIYDIGCVERILSDIITCFSQDYVVSGPVWEYFDDPEGAWQAGMKREIERDLLNGFIGKTVIHPKQIAVVNCALQVCKQDYADATAILDLCEHTELLVARGVSSGRMNEYKTHIRWAQRICARAEIYGVQA